VEGVIEREGVELGVLDGEELGVAIGSRLAVEDG
jgi:hypothetical protein